MPFTPTTFRLRPLSLAVMTALLPGTLAAAPVNWVPDANGFWDVVTNWSSNPALPGAADDVTLDVGGATVRTITHRSGTNTINSLTSQEDFILQGGSLNLNGASTVNGLYTMQGGTLGGTGNLTLAGGAVLSGGTFTGAATTVLEGTTTISGGIGLDAGRVLQNTGTANWTGGSIDLNNLSTGGSGRLENLAGAVIDAQGNNTLSATNFGDLNLLPGFPVFNNAGTFRKSAGTGTTTISVALNHTGLIEVQSGTLSLTGGSTSSGDFVGGAGGILLFGGGTHNLDANADITTVNTTFSSGTVNHAGTYSASGTTSVTGGATVNLTGTVASLGSALSISNGTLNVGGSSATVGTFTQSGGVLTGVGALTVSGTATLSGGTMSGAGTTVLEGPTSLSGYGLDAGRILENRGTMTWTAGTFDLNNLSTGGSGRLDNISGAIIDAQGNNTISATNFGDIGSLPGFPVFNNAGTFRKSAGTGTTTISVALNHTGLIEVQSGTLSLTGGSTSSGDFTGAAGTTLQFSGGTHTLDANADITTANTTFSSGTVNHAGVYNTSGTTLVSGGTVNLTGTLSSLGQTLNVTNGLLNLSGSPAAVSNFSQSGGTLSGLSAFTVSGQSTLSGGTMTGVGTTVLEGPTTLTGYGLDSGRILENRGVMTWTAGTFDLNNQSNGGAGRFDNAVDAVLDSQANTTLSATNFGDLNSLPGFPVFNNAGTFRKSAGVGTTNISTVFNNTGLVEVLNGTINLSGGGTSSGDFTGAAGTTLQFGGGTHNLDANVDITTANTTFSSGTVNHAGTYNTSGTTLVSGATVNLTSTLSNLGAVLNITNGTLNIAGSAATVTTFTQSGGVLSGTGNLTVNEAATLSGGTMSGAGTTVLESGGNISGLGLDAGRVLQNEGVLNWTSGTIDLNSLSTNGSGRIDNAADALFDARNNNTLQATNFADLNSLAGFPVFNNAGTFRKSVGTGATTVGVAFNNTGAVEVQTGTVNLTAGGTSSGTFEIAAGATLQFGGGTHTLSNVDGVSSVGRLLMSSGTVNAAGTLNNGGLLEITNGTLNLDGDATTDSYIQSGGTLSGTGELTVSGAATLAGGTMTGAGTTRLQSGATVSGFGLDAGRVLLNEGVLNWTGGTIDLNSLSTNGSGRIDNAADALFDARNNNALQATNFADLNSLAGFPVFNNAGTFRKSVGTGTTTVGVAFNNTGAVEVQTGTVNLTAGGTSSGTFEVAAGSTLQFGGGTHTLSNVDGVSSGGRLLVSSGTVNAVGTLSNGGLLEITNGTLNLDGDATTDSYTQSGGTLSGTGELTVNGAANLTGGTMTGAGTTRLQSGGNISGLGLDAGRVLLNEGVLNWTGGTIDLNSLSTNGSGRIDNAADALFDARNNNTLQATNFADLNALAGFPVFNNAGTFRKSAGTGTTTVGVRFNNTGLLDVQTGTVNLTSGSSHVGDDAIVTAAGATLSMAGGTHVLDGMTASGDGRVQFQSGTLDVTANNATITSEFLMSGGTRAGDGVFTLTGLTTLSGGTFVGGAQTVLAGQTTINGGISIDLGHVLTNEGTLSWTGGTIDLNGLPNNGGAGRLDNALDALLEARGSSTIQATNFSDLNALPGFPVFNNAGTFRKAAGVGTTTVSTRFNNTGATEVEIGIVSLTGDVLQHTGNTLTGGTWRVSGNGTLNLNESGAVNITTNQGDVTLDGANANFSRINSLLDNQGAFRLLGARDFTAAGAFTNSGVLQLAGGSFAAPSLSNTSNGEIFGFGTITPTVQNSGLVRAAGGTLTVTGGIDGQSGTLQSDAGATLALGANSDGDVLINNGTLALGTFNVTVDEDYQNGNFGSGNAFNARANVTGSGQILASGDVAQALTGDVTGGTGAAPQMAFGNIHVGDVVNRAFQVANTGTSGPALRGALQTAVNGGNLTDGRLTGTGASEGAFGAVLAGTASDDFVVTFTGSSAGALSGQSMAVVNNFDNVAEQVLGISGAVYRYANPSAHTPEPVVFANARVGDLRSQALTLSNDVEADGFSEALDASIGGATAGITTNANSISLLAAGATDSTSLVVGIDTSTAGAKVGTATISLASNGSGTSGLGITDLGTQTVNVSGDVYRLASASPHTPAPVAFGNRRVGDAASQALSLTNTAAADGFSERLNASIGGATGNVTTNGGSISLLAAGATNNSDLVVTLDTSTAGAKSGTATISLASDGAGTSGFSAFDLGTQTVNVSGDVYRLASPGAHSPSPVSFGNRRVGDSASQALTLANTAIADGFSESLNASIGGATGNVTTNGGSTSLLAAGATDSTNLVVTLDTATAGAKSGTATISLASDGTGTSGFSAFDLGTQTVNVSGDVYRLASAGPHSPSPVVFANRHVGDAASQALSLANTAAADGFSESLNASIGGTTGNVTTNGGSISLLAAGATNNTNLVVNLDTSTAGAKSGTATISLASDGTGTSGFSAFDLGTQTVDVSGNVYRYAEAGAIAAVVFGNVHVGANVSQALSLSNIAAADGFSESLNAVFEGSSDARILTAGSVSGLAAGATDSSSLVVSLDTSSAGALTGFTSLRLTSDGTGTSELGLTDLGVRNVGVTTNVAVYRFAEAAIDTAQPIDFGALRVGDVAGDVALAVSNTAANDGFSEALNADIGSVSTGFNAAGSISLLAAGQSNAAALSVGLDTATSGDKSGSVSVDFVSDGSGTSGLGQTALASQSVAVQGRVYQQAVANVETAAIDFGIVHVGDTVSSRSISVRNDANGALNDSLRGSVLGTATGFSASGSLGANGLAAGTSSAAIGIALDTSVAGFFAGNAVLGFASHNAEMSDLDLGTANVALNAAVFNYANPVLTAVGGDGSFNAVGTSFTLDFGTLSQGSSGLLGLLALTNLVAGPADDLGATFDLGSGPFALTGFADFNGLAAEDSRSLTVGFDALTAGLFEQVIGIELFGENASGYFGSLGTFELTIRAEVAPVPVPAAVWMFGSALAGLWGARRRRA